MSENAINAVCVYCGSNPGTNPEHAAAASQLGTFLAETGRTLVYGGGRVGLMGCLADATLSAGGRVIGVIPRSLVEKEVAHSGLTELHVVETMHQRKTLMAELADGFLVLPGGIGTLEEFFEIWTWEQLGLHSKPIGLLNAAGFFNSLLQFVDQLVEQKFLRPEHRELVLMAAHARPLLSQMEQYRPAELPKWITPDGP